MRSEARGAGRGQQRLQGGLVGEGGRGTGRRVEREGKMDEKGRRAVRRVRQNESRAAVDVERVGQGRREKERQDDLQDTLAASQG